MNHHLHTTQHIEFCDFKKLQKCWKTASNQRKTLYVNMEKWYNLSRYMHGKHLLGGVNLNVQEAREKLEQVRSELLTVDRNNRNDVARYNELKQEEAALIEVVQKEEQTEQATGAREEIYNQFDQMIIAGETLTLRQMAADEDSYQLLSAWIQEQFESKTIALLQESTAKVDALKKSYESDIAELEAKVDEKDADIARLTTELAKANDRAFDAESKRDAAANELFEQHREVERLNSQVDDLRKEIAVGARAAIQVETNLSGNLAEAMEKYKNSRPAIYDVQPTDPLRKIEFSAKYAATGEPLTDKYVYIGKYRVMDEQEAARFRAEHEANKPAEQSAEPVQEDTSADTALVTGAIEPPTFPAAEVPDQDPTYELAEGHSPVEVAGSSDTLEERVWHLECETTQLHNWLTSLSKHTGYDLTQIDDAELEEDVA